MMWEEMAVLESSKVATWELVIRCVLANYSRNEADVDPKLVKRAL